MPTKRQPSKAQPQYINPEVLNAYLIGVKDDVAEIKTTLSKLTDAVAGIERLEMRQIGIVADMEKGAVVHKEFDRRLTVVERDMPGLRELRKWVVGGMVTGIGMMLIALSSLVLNPARGYVVMSPASASAPSSTVTTTNTRTE